MGRGQLGRRWVQLCQRGRVWGRFLGPVGRWGRDRVLRGRGEDRVHPVGGGVGEEAVGERKRRLLHQTPLHDARVLPACRDQVTVLIQETDVGHMTAVGAVLMAGSLQTQIID